MIIVGHRGARGLAPENTLASISKALEHQVDIVEFDLRVTKDDIAIAHHNRKLIDPSGQKFKIAEYTYKELKDHKPDLATFEEILKLIGKNKPIYVEVKPGVPVDPIVAIIKKYLERGWKKENFILGSFSQKTLVDLHENLPDIRKIVIEKWSGVRARFRAKQVNTKMIAMSHHVMWFGYIAAAKRAGYQLYTYPLNNPAKAKRWEKYGLCGVVTDYPDRFQK